MASQGFTAFDDRPRRLHLLLDSYGYDTSGFGANVAARAQMNAAGIERLANSDPTRRCHHVSVGKRGIRALCAPSIADTQGIADGDVDQPRASREPFGQIGQRRIRPPSSNVEAGVSRRRLRVSPRRKVMYAPAWLSNHKAWTT